jgi:hypothetical protein
MTRLRQRYTLGVLWLLSVIAKDAAASIYRRGHEDGMTELRDFMRRELTAVQAASAANQLRLYNQGFNDAMRLYGDVPNETPIERVM